MKKRYKGQTPKAWRPVREMPRCPGYDYAVRSGAHVRKVRAEFRARLFLYLSGWQEGSEQGIH